MDIVTQGLVGGTMALAFARRRESKIAVLIGFAAGLLADADALIRSPGDPLLTVEFHRHFSHSLFFIPFGAGIAFLILWPFLRRRISPQRLYLYALLGYSMSGLLDSCTSYGTLLLWPLSSERFAWSIISIFDPVFSFILVFALIYGVTKARPAVARGGLLLAGAYLAAGVFQQHQAETAIHELARQRGHTIERQVVKPTVANLVLWRSVYESEGVFFIDAVRIMPFSSARIYPGGRLAKFDTRRDLPELKAGSAVAHDISRFIRFSDNFVARHPARQNMLIDVRYSLLPTGVAPLWGIEMPLTSQHQHSRFIHFRKISATDRSRFIRMLAGSDLPSTAQ